jgi:lipoprotein-anchoring transpeptidase ErfK/SrfK
MQTGLEPATARQNVTFTTTPAVQSSAFNANTRFVRVVADADARLAFGADPTAVVTTDTLIVSGNAEYFAVVPGHKLSVIEVV